MTRANAPTLHHAVRLYGQWRTNADGRSLLTWSGEAPGLLAFADYCAEAGVEQFWLLNTDLLEDWWANQQARLGEATVATRLHQLRSFLHWAMRKGWLVDDPTLLIRATPPAREERVRLDARGLLDLIEAADYPQHRIVLALCANLALRQAEIKTLLMRDLDLAKGELLVHIHKTRKTPPDRMPITAELDGELRRWLDHYRAAQPGLTPDSHLVPSQHYTPLSGRVTYRPDRSVAEPEDIVKRALTGLGWPEEAVKGEGIHLVRRSVARIYFDAAEAEESYHEALLGTMRLLHHDRPETTLHYIGVDRQTLARDRFLRGRPFLTRLAHVPPTLRAVN
jgi:integrase